MRGLILAIFLLASSFAKGEIIDLNSEALPTFEGDTLYIRGRIDSNIYNTLAYDADKVAKVKYIELLSFGGNVSQAFLIAEKIKGLHKITRIGAGGFCASACVLLFAAGAEREIAADAWIGIHSARLGPYYAEEFNTNCKASDAQGVLIFDQNKTGCQEYMRKWYATVAQVTDDMFAFYESNGVSLNLRATYFAFPLIEPDWVLDYNVMKTPDWKVDADTAISFNLATRKLIN